MATAPVNREFIEAVAAEMTSGIHAALECWMTRIEAALESPTLTSLGKLIAVREILEDYKDRTGKAKLECRRSVTAH